MSSDSSLIEEIDDLLAGGGSSGSTDNEYARSHYLLFGADDDTVYSSVLDAEGTREYLMQAGTAESSLTQARRRRREADKYTGYHGAGERFCDFCGRVLTGAEYERLKDGRDRCTDCSKTVVKGAHNYEAVFYQTRAGLCEQFSIDLPAQMTVEVVSQAKLSNRIGTKFVPTEYFDSRAVGLATDKRGQYGIMLENGVPRISLVSTCAHELTHIWQYSHWDRQALKAKYGKAMLAVEEGMAKWAEIQYLYLINEAAQADRTLEREVARTDVYGYGLRLFLNKYSISRGVVLEGDTPFMHPTAPL